MEDLDLGQGEVKNDRCESLFAGIDRGTGWLVGVHVCTSVES